MAAHMMSGVRRSEHITPVLEYLHWRPVSQRVVFKTALTVWKCVHGVAPAYLSDLCVPATAISGRQHRRSAATGTLVPRALRSPDRFQAGTEDAPVLDRPAPLRRLHHSGAGYKYPDLLTYLLTLSDT